MRLYSVQCKGCAIQHRMRSHYPADYVYYVG